MHLQGSSFMFGLALLLMPLAATAQRAGEAPDARGLVTAGSQHPVQPATAMQESEVAALKATAQASLGSAAAEPKLDTMNASQQLSLPAGVCPVITDYLFQQCQQNPDDAMCAPAGAN